MKKFFYLIAAVAMFSFVSCGNKAQKETADVQNDTISVEEVCDSTLVEVADTLVVDTIVVAE